MISLGLTTPLVVERAASLWTCHLVHWDAAHLTLNLAGALPPLALLHGRLRRQMTGWALAAAPLVSLAVLASGFQGEYRGASGLVAGMWVYAGVTLLRKSDRRLGIAMLSLVTAKVALESSGMWPAVSPDFETIVVAHYAGGIAGLAALRPEGRDRPALLAATEDQRRCAGT